MPLIAIVGAHGVGKTTVGRLLAERLGFPFDEEIGAVLAADPAWRSGGATAEVPQRAFDLEVFRRELARDATAPPARVVESWHPGNLAYAERRSPGVVPTLLSDLRAVAVVGAVCVPLLAPPEVLAHRASEPGDVRFFDAVGHAGALWAARLGVRVTRPIWTHLTPPVEIVDQIASLLTEALWNASS